MANSVQHDLAVPGHTRALYYNMKEACSQNKHQEFINGIFKIAFYIQSEGEDNTPGTPTLVSQDDKFLVFHGRNLINAPQMGETIADGAIAIGTITYSLEVKMFENFCGVTFIKPESTPVSTSDPLVQAIINSCADGHTLCFAFGYDESHERGYYSLSLVLKIGPSDRFAIGAGKVPSLPFPSLRFDSELDAYSKGLIEEATKRDREAGKMRDGVSDQGGLDKGLLEGAKEGQEGEEEQDNNEVLKQEDLTRA